MTQFDFVVNSNLQRRVSLSYTVARDTKKNDGAKESLKPLEQKLRKIEDITNDIREELRHHREREAEHRDANGTYSCPNIIVHIAVRVTARTRVLSSVPYD